MAEEQDKKSFKVVDSRRFDSDGAPKEKARNEGGAPASDSVSPQSTPPPSDEHSSDQLSFSTFVVSLGTQALMQLGEIPPPDGIKIEKDVKAAKNYIDIIDILKKKTSGNLDAAEAQLLEQILYSLRMAFVRATAAR